MPGKKGQNGLFSPFCMKLLKIANFVHIFDVFRQKMQIFAVFHAILHFFGQNRDFQVLLYSGLVQKPRGARGIENHLKV